MAYDLYTGDPYDTKAKVAYLMQMHQYARSMRVNHEVLWEEGSAIVWPGYRNSWAFGHVRAPGVKYTQFQVDSSATIKAMRFAAICDAFITPHNMLWSKIVSDDEYLMKQRAAKIYYEDLSRQLWKLRYAPDANFTAVMQSNWQALGVLGNYGAKIDKLDARPVAGRGFRYIQQHPGVIYLLVNHQGKIDGCIRHFRWNARQARQRWGDKIPPVLASALEKADVFTMFDFLEFVIPRTDYDPYKIFSAQGKPWSSIYVSVIGYEILEEGGYYSFPVPYGRYLVAPEEWYGRGPTDQVLPELKTKNSEKEAFLKQGGLAGDPMYLLPDDGLFDFKAVQGSYVYGGMNPDGKPLVATLKAGEIQITKELMEDSDRTIDASFSTDLFPMLFDKNGTQRSAREVIEVANQIGIFLQPTLGRQFNEFLPQLITRELDLGTRMGLLPPPPPVVKEAGARHHVLFTGPLARALDGQGIAGFMRTVEQAAQVSQAMGGSPEPLDWVDADVAFPEIAEMQYSPSRWTRSAQAIAKLRQGRAQQAEREARAKEMPAQAAIMKANAIAAKAQAGQNTGGTLSGMPQSGMPVIPGNPQGTSGQPGAFGRPGQPGMPG